MYLSTWSPIFLYILNELRFQMVDDIKCDSDIAKTKDDKIDSKSQSDIS